MQHRRLLAVRHSNQVDCPIRLPAGRPSTKNTSPITAITTTATGTNSTTTVSRG
ncbi:MAG: hypothetical protein AW07_00245 [Candidatus Accumulibacter sp. SK-11]|nr:MAG: hypothetical protein AW07_00245 [Candidatus Accumulibacter sp. SK-11]